MSEFTCQTCSTALILEDVDQVDWTPLEALFGPFEVPSGADGWCDFFTKLSETCAIEFPLCEPCSAKASDAGSARTNQLMSQVDLYSKVFDRFDTSHLKPLPKAEDISLLESQEQFLENRMETLRSRRAQIAEEGENIEFEESRLISLIEFMWETFHILEFEQSKHVTESGHTHAKHAGNQFYSYTIEHTNALDDCFHIFYDGHFGTINGFRLGRLQSQQVGWSEINAALGQCVLLVDSIAKHVQFQFKDYVLQPNGSFPRIVRLKDGSSFELYGQKRSYWFHNFDLAITFFLNCVHQIGEFAENDCGRSIFKYSIVDDTVGGLSVKFHGNQDEKSTKALKYLLLNLKSLIYWSARYAE